MLNRLVLAAVAAGFTATAAMAQDKPSNTDECLQTSFELAQSAEGKKLDDAKLDELEKMLSAMEGHCDKGEFDQAAAVSKDIKAAIGN